MILNSILLPIRDRVQVVSHSCSERVKPKASKCARDLFSLDHTNQAIESSIRGLRSPAAINAGCQGKTTGD